MNCPILILHGWGSCAKNWSRVREFLESGGCQVYVPDLPGFGEAPPPERPWSMSEYVGWVKEFCEKQNLSHFFLLGHSFGGGMAVKFVSLFPEKVRALVLVDAKVRRQKTIRYYFGLVLAKMGGWVFSIPVLSFLQPLGRKILYFIVGTRDYYELELKKTITMKETFKKVVKEDLTPCLLTIKIPTLIIWGQRDKLTPLRDAYLMKEKIPQANLEILPKINHNPQSEDPQILAEKTLNFIKNL